MFGSFAAVRDDDHEEAGGEGGTEEAQAAGKGKGSSRGQEQCPGIGGTVSVEKLWREARNGVKILEVQLLWISNGVRPGTTSRCWKYSYFGEAMARGQESCQCVEDTLLNSSMMTSAVKCVCA